MDVRVAGERPSVTSAVAGKSLAVSKLDNKISKVKFLQLFDVCHFELIAMGYA